MLWLIIHMWALLAAAFMLGLAVGWWVQSGRGKPETQAEAPMGSLHTDYKDGDLH